MTRLARSFLALAVLGGVACSTARAAVSSSATPTAATTTSPSVASSAGAFTLTSPVMSDGGELPVDFTCDGSSISPPLEWSGAPAGTVGYAVAMHHVPGPGDTHWYWVLYDIPAEVTHIDAGVTPVAKVGTNSVNGRSEYTPPCSKGPGEKVYTITVYALSAPPDLPDPSVVTRDVLLAAIDGSVLASADIDVTYDRTGLTS